MKRTNINFVALLVIFGLVATPSCKKEDPTTFAVKQAFTQPVGTTSPAVRADGTLFFTGSTVELSWASANTGGDAVSWNVYFGGAKTPPLFQSDVKTNKITVPVTDGVTYYWFVEIVDSRGIVTTSVTNHFTAINGTNPKFIVTMTAQTDVKTAVGLDLVADKVVDLRLLIVNKSDMSVAATVDAAKANETFRGFQDLPDGDYLIGVDIKSTINAGDVNSPITVDLSVKFAQLGLVDSTLEFPGVMNNISVCNYYRTYLATVKKVGAAYTVTRSVESWIDPAVTDPSALVGIWSGDRKSVV